MNRRDFLKRGAVGGLLAAGLALVGKKVLGAEPVGGAKTAAPGPERGAAAGLPSCVYDPPPVATPYRYVGSFVPTPGNGYWMLNPGYPGNQGLQHHWLWGQTNATYAPCVDWTQVTHT